MNGKTSLIGAAAITLLASSAVAAPPTICAELNSAIDRNIVEIALSEFEGDMNDKSAAQQGARLVQNSNRLSTIMLNIQLQAQNKCPPRQKPIDASIYRAQAQGCYLARAKILRGDKEVAANAAATIDQICDLKAWDAQANK